MAASPAGVGDGGGDVGAGGLHSLKQGKVDSLNGRRGMVVSLDIEEYERAVDLFGFVRIPGDDGPGELVQSFDQGMCWNVRWTRTGKLGNYYTGAYKLYQLRVGANDTDKNALDIVLRDVRARMEGNGGGPASADTRMISLRTPEPLR